MAKEHLPIQKVTLASLMQGAAGELFEMALVNAIANCVDPNTPHKTKRKIALVLTILPDEARENAAFMLECKSVLAQVKPAATMVRIGLHEGLPVAVEPFVQEDMFKPAPGPRAVPVHGGAQ